MAEKLEVRTVAYTPTIKIVAWAQLEDGGIYIGRAVWGEGPLSSESTMGIIREGAMPVGETAKEAVDMAVLEVKKMIGLGILRQS